jgi:hypothetical protein
MLQAYNEFRNVAHFWGAFLHGQQHERQDIWPGAPETLPTFLSYAEAILELACALPSFAGDRRFAATRAEAWSFIMPGQIGPAQLLPLPLNEEQIAILNEHEKRNPLI